MYAINFLLNDVQSAIKFITVIESIKFKTDHYISLIVQFRVNKFLAKKAKHRMKEFYC